MSETGHRVFPAERFIQEIVKGQGGKPFLSADDLRDFHQMVVHDIGKVIGGEFIGPFPEHFVVQGVRVHLHVAADQVFHFHDTAQRHLEADGPVGGGFQKPLHFFRAQAERIAETAPRGGIVHERLFGSLGGGAAAVQLFGRIKGVVRPSGSHQLLCILAVDGAPLALPVRSVRMTGRCRFHHLSVLVHALVGDDAAPAQGFYDILLRSGDKTVGIRIFDAEDEVSSFLFGIEVIIQGRAHAAHVERAGGGRGKSYAGSFFHIFCNCTAKIMIFSYLCRGWSARFISWAS